MYAVCMYARVCVFDKAVKNKDMTCSWRTRRWEKEEERRKKEKDRERKKGREGRLTRRLGPLDHERRSQPQRLDTQHHTEKQQGIRHTARRAKTDDERRVAALRNDALNEQGRDGRHDDGGGDDDGLQLLVALVVPAACVGGG